MPAGHDPIGGYRFSLEHNKRGTRLREDHARSKIQYTALPDVDGDTGFALADGAEECFGLAFAFTDGGGEAGGAAAAGGVSWHLLRRQASSAKWAWPRMAMISLR